ncbi:MAG: cytochrome oxidase Cu insertion factor (SCO1/SenC/PrrC family) [Candidatus Endobugula sp.]|jgi:cytochrome oxidase Cu insertion factor (SCO1/SenC/PrrC family)
MSQQNSTDDNQHTEAGTVIKRNRFFGLVIIAIVTSPMLIAYIMYQTGWGVSANTTNKGELINPSLPIKSLLMTSEIRKIDGADIDGKSENSIEEEGQGLGRELSEEWQKKWRLLVPVSQHCGTVCQKNLYTTRQVHIRLAEKAYRVERIILSLDTLSDELEQQLKEKHPNTRRVDTSAASLADWLAAANMATSADNYYYLVDQEGSAMMRYDVSHTGQDLLDDIKKLLKFTYDK